MQIRDERGDNTTQNVSRTSEGTAFLIVYSHATLFAQPKSDIVPCSRSGSPGAPPWQNGQSRLLMSMPLQPYSSPHALQCRR